MNDKQKAQLAVKLSGDKAFDSAYTRQNRVWFARAMVEASAAVKPDSAVEAEAKRLIAEANKRVAADRSFMVGVTLDSALSTFERKDVRRRVETIYGVIAHTAALAESSLDPLRRFLVRRRYRMAVRMVYQVNPNSNGFFHYPGQCALPPPPGRRAWRTNVDTKDLWEPFTIDDVPLRVKVPIGGTADPRTAAEKLWIAHVNACDSNLFDCASAISCVLMDSLFESADSDKVFKAVYSRGTDHLAIGNPNKRKEQQFLWDKPAEPRRLFSKEQVLPGDLQIGDHVYIWNHGLYPQLEPFGFWSGEHAIVTSCGTRKFGDGKGFLFSGHGMDTPQTVEALHDDLIKMLQTNMHRVYAIARLFLAFRRSGDTSIPAAKVDKEQFQMTTANGTQIDVLGYSIEADVKFGDYTAKPKRDGSPPMVTESLFVVFDIPALKVILIAVSGVDTIALQRKVGIAKMTPLVRTTEPSAGENVYDRALWQISYRDSDTDTEEHFPLFGGPKGTFLKLDRKKMPKYKFGRLLSTDAGALVTRPTSEVSTTYTSFLRTSGALT